MGMRPLLLVLTLGAAGLRAETSPATPPEGLLVDLDATRGITLDAQGRVAKWVNQVGPAETREFVGQDKGRKVPGSGLPALVKAAGQPAVSFRAQELLCADEKAFDGLIKGDGCTWIAVLKPYAQAKGGLKDVNSFFGNLRNGGKYEGVWGCLDDDNTIWWGARNGLTFGRFDVNNPKVAGPKLEAGRRYIVAGRLGAGTGEVAIELFVDDVKPVATARFPVNPNADASKLAVGQERDATQHPGYESFDGEIGRFLLWGRPLKDDELATVMASLRPVPAAVGK
jgi:hypothetical protein